MNDIDRDRQRTRIDHNATTLLALVRWGGIALAAAVFAAGGAWWQVAATADGLAKAEARIEQISETLSDLKGDVRVIRSETAQTGQLLRDFFRRGDIQ